jgi:hypothetical protein
MGWQSAAATINRLQVASHHEKRCESIPCEKAIAAAAAPRHVSNNLRKRRAHILRQAPDSREVLMLQKYRPHIEQNVQISLPLVAAFAEADAHHLPRIKPIPYRSQESICTLDFLSRSVRYQSISRRTDRTMFSTPN